MRGVSEARCTSSVLQPGMLCRAPYGGTSSRARRAQQAGLRHDEGRELPGARWPSFLGLVLSAVLRMEMAAVCFM